MQTGVAETRVCLWLPLIFLTPLLEVCCFSSSIQAHWGTWKHQFPFSGPQVIGELLPLNPCLISFCLCP